MVDFGLKPPLAPQPLLTKFTKLLSFPPSAAVHLCSCVRCRLSLSLQVFVCVMHSYSPLCCGLVQEVGGDWVVHRPPAQPHTAGPRHHAVRAVQGLLTLAVKTLLYGRTAAGAGNHFISWNIGQLLS